MTYDSDEEDFPLGRGSSLSTSTTVIEGKKKLDFSEYYEIQLWDLRTPNKVNFKQSFSHLNALGVSRKSNFFWKSLNIIKPILAPLLIMSSLSLLILMVFILDNRLAESKLNNTPCISTCRTTLVESIPENLTYSIGSPTFLDTFSAWNNLLDDAKESIDLVAYYWSLLNNDITPIEMPSAWQGEAIFQRLFDIASNNKNISIRIAQDMPSKSNPQNDSKLLEEQGAQVRSLDFDALMGAGVLHTKMWIVDRRHIYVGSANMDWRSLTQVKELGILIQDCPCLVEDFQKIFEVYWILGNSTEIPAEWPPELTTVYNLQNPMNVTLENQESQVFASSAPLPFNPTGRTNDVDAVTSIIKGAKKFIYIAVMDYFPRMLYTGSNEFWPIIDDELRRAALDNGVEVKLLGSHWNHTRKDMVRWLRSLQDLTGLTYPHINIQTRLFEVPTYTPEQANIPYSRVNHNKYMVTDETAYIGTSNWSGDYFVNTAGVSISFSEKKSNETTPEDDEAYLREQLVSIFERDWNSPYAKSIDEIVKTEN